MNPDGTGRSRLTTHPGDDLDPAWSPDGSTIAFQSQRDGVGDIYVMNADGMDQRRLTDLPSSYDRTPVWSPDGSRIAFVSDRDTEGFRNVEVYIMNADGSGQANLTKSEGDDKDPDWRPLGSGRP